MDKNLKAADGVIDRLSRLYRWIVKKQQADDATRVTLPERIIVLLADERARRGEGLTLEELEVRTMTPIGKIVPELKRLHSLSVVVDSGGQWTLRTAPD